MLAGPNDKVRVLTVVVALAVLSTRSLARGDPDSLPGPTPQILIRNPGEPGSKPFPGFVSSKSNVGAKQNVASESEPVLAASTRSQLSAPEKSAKIIPVKRTRFRSRDNRKIVLKRRKVKRLRARPKPDPDGVALAPEAHRGGSLAELALATLSAEELSAEVARGHQNGITRDIQIMEIPKPRNREQNTLTFPSRVKVALKKDKPNTKPARTGKKSERLNINVIRNNIFDPRKRPKGIKKNGFKERLRSPESEESSTIPSVLPHSVVSPFPNFPMINPGVDELLNQKTQEHRDGRAETEVEIPNIGFEELTLTPGKPGIDLSSEPFIPILRPDTKSNQRFPGQHAAPDSQQSSALHRAPVTPVKGQPLPISQFLDYGESQDPDIPAPPQAPLPPSNFETKFENFPKLPAPTVGNRPGLTSLSPGVPSVPNSPPFPDIFNSPQPQHPDFPPLPSVSTPFTTTPQPIFQTQPLDQVEELPKSNFSPGPDDAAKMTGHSETVVGNSVVGQLSYVDVDGSVRQLSYKKSAPAPSPPAPPAPPAPPLPPAPSPAAVQPLAPAFLRPVRPHPPPPPPPHLLPKVPHPQEPPLNIRHHGSTVVPRLIPTSAPVLPAQPSTHPHLASPVPPKPSSHPHLVSPVPTVSHQPTPFIHTSTQHSNPPPPARHTPVLPSPLPVRHSFIPPSGLSPFSHPEFKTTVTSRPSKIISVQPTALSPHQPRPVILPTFTPAPPFYPSRFQPHPPLRPAVPPPHHQHRPHHTRVHKLPSLTFFPPHLSPSPPSPTPRPSLRPQLVSTIRPTAVKTSSASLPPGPTPPSFRITEHYPSPSPIPAIWQPRGVLFTPKPFVHIHTTVVPVVLRSSPPPQHFSTTKAPHQYSTTKAPHRFTTPHPHFFTTPYPQTPYPPLQHSPTPRPAPFLLHQSFPYNGHGIPAHLPRVSRREDLQTGASELSEKTVTVQPDNSQDNKEPGAVVTTEGEPNKDASQTRSKKYTTSRNYRLSFHQT